MTLFRADSELDVCNLALSQIKKPALADLNAKFKKSAKECRRHYPVVRDALQRDYVWNFCTSWQSIGQVNPAPISKKWSAAYQLPGDCLRVLEVEGLSSNDWVVESDNRLLCVGTGAKNMNLIIRNTEPGKWDALYLTMTMYRLGTVLAPVLAHSTTLADRLDKMFKEHEMRAKRADAYESSEPVSDYTPAYIAARQVGHGH